MLPEYDYDWDFKGKGRPGSDCRVAPNPTHSEKEGGTWISPGTAPLRRT
jgi:hypothetical protein